MYIFSKKKYEEQTGRFFLKGWNEGFEIGSSKAIHEFRKVLIKRIQKEIKEVSSMVDREYLDGLEQAIDLIRKGK